MLEATRTGECLDIELALIVLMVKERARQLSHSGRSLFLTNKASVEDLLRIRCCARSFRKDFFQWPLPWRCSQFSGGEQCSQTWEAQPCLQECILSLYPDEQLEGDLSVECFPVYGLQNSGFKSPCTSLRATQSIRKERKKPNLTKKKKKKKKKNHENHPAKNAQFYLLGSLHGAGCSVSLPRGEEKLTPVQKKRGVF
ncbi:neurotrimin isoform X21 [Macaca fascicularis]|uniref:neurotrimin isoform X21 n=1 Tax=Macaca fascicularis TaxID=9541 RepID=UPI003D15C6EA